LLTVTVQVCNMYFTNVGTGFVYTFQKLKIFVKFVKRNSKSTQTNSHIQFIVYFLIFINPKLLGHKSIYKTMYSHVKHYN